MVVCKEDCRLLLTNLACHCLHAIPQIERDALLGLCRAKYELVFADRVSAVVEKFIVVLKALSCTRYLCGCLDPTVVFISLLVTGLSGA